MQYYFELLGLRQFPLKFKVNGNPLMAPYKTCQDGSLIEIQTYLIFDGHFLKRIQTSTRCNSFALSIVIVRHMWWRSFCIWAAGVSEVVLLCAMATMFQKF